MGAFGKIDKSPSGPFGAMTKPEVASRCVVFGDSSLNGRPSNHHLSAMSRRVPRDSDQLLDLALRDQGSTQSTVWHYWFETKLLDTEVVYGIHKCETDTVQETGKQTTQDVDQQQ